MNLFFGKISQKIDTAQLTDGYYSSDKGSSWYGELELGDYVYMIGGDKIQFWQAREWGVKNGRESLLFDVLNSDLGINVSQLIALKFLKITKSLAVLTSRSARNKAFFKLETIKDIPIADLSNNQYYKNEDLFRTINIIKSENIIKNSDDFQLIYENGKLHLQSNEFTESEIKHKFVDNLIHKGKGARMKDNVLEFFSNKIKKLPATISHSDIGLRSFYDTFFCDYKEKSIVDNEDENYWVFQGNPKIYNAVNALNANAVKTWTVSAHRDKIKKGDKIILWLTGSQAGCYALGSVASEVTMMKEEDVEMRYYLTPEDSIEAYRVKIIIEHQFVDSPILWEMIKEDDVFKDFKGSNQGTNFTATKEQYDHFKTHLTSTILNNTIMISNPLNQILYGPPGTGKTYNTVLEAAKVVTGNNEISYDNALEVFKANLDNQIEFITFHQNYSYEDFIQGLRPDTENGSALTFEKKDGVFKRIADRALKNLVASENPASAKKEFDIVFQELIQPLNDGDVTEVEIKMKKSSFFITAVGEKSIDFRKNIGDSEHTLSINTLRKMYEKGTNDIILGGLQPYYNPILDLLLEKGKSQLTAVEKKNYVIIIDEINRANISRVFGELITLIEEDKRSHGAIPIRVTLPSGDPFIVPSNLFIIGTMNTADKSIALLDIALRRRFEFKPMYPLYDGLKKPIHDSEKLKKINDAIISRKNHDFTIGHAYFMGDNYTLEKTINTKVIPLLLEYFMNSEKDVKEILKEAGITIDNWPLKMIL
ncbi:AAA family ATPase [Flavobacterium sp. RSB2_4_14]|uniref:AAA family ATPase n=1 Tax=Flavobacterium sp. RSB2_4_14 TaxID=3447665 RepID=UPI003F3A6F54